MNINATLIGQSISFFIFVWLVMEYVWPPLMAALEERKQKIADGLAAAERGSHERELAEKRAIEVIHEAKEQAALIISQAQGRANELVDDAKGNARTESEKILEGAQAEIDRETSRAREQLREQLSALVIVGAEQVLAREVNESDHNELLSQLSTQL